MHSVLARPVHPKACIDWMVPSFSSLRAKIGRQYCTCTIPKAALCTPRGIGSIQIVVLVTPIHPIWRFQHPQYIAPTVCREFSPLSGFSSVTHTHSSLSSSNHTAVTRYQLWPVNALLTIVLAVAVPAWRQGLWSLQHGPWRCGVF